jgi:DNA-binding NarL/FixJ family response regulator
VPGIRAILLTGNDDNSVLRAAVASGCAGYITKGHASDALVSAIRSVTNGGVALDPDTLARLAAAPPRRNGPHTLTARELDVIRMLAVGVSTRELADRLFISPTTARNHLQRINAKLGAHSRLEAVAIAAREGLVPIGGDASHAVNGATGPSGFSGATPSRSR